MNKKKADIGYIVLMVCFIAYFIMFEVLNIFYARFAINSDGSGFGICAKVFWEAKSLIPPNFYAWTESGAFSLTVLGALIYGITGSTLAARGLGIAIGTALILLAVYRLFLCMGTSKKGIAIGLLSFLCIPIGFFSQTMTFLSYAPYSLCVITMFLVLTDYIQFVTNNLKHQWLYLIFHLLLAIANGCNSSRAILVVYAPLFIVECVRYFLRIIKEKKVWNKKEGFTVALVFALTISGYVATYLPFSVQTSMSKSFRRSPIKLITEVLPALGEWLGLKGTTNPILLFILIIMVVLTIAVAIYVLYKHDIEDKYQLAIAFLWCNMLLTAVMLSITQTDVASRYFFMSFYILSFSMVFLYEKLGDKNVRVTNTAIVILVIYAILNALVSYVPVLKEKPISKDTEEIVSYMTENGYYYGYADYMDANAMSDYSDGKVQIAAVHIENLSIWRWITDTHWYRPYLEENMKTAYIINKASLENFSSVLEQHDDIKFAYETENYSIFTSDRNYSYID